MTHVWTVWALEPSGGKDLIGLCSSKEGADARAEKFMREAQEELIKIGGDDAPKWEGPIDAGDRIVYKVPGLSQVHIIQMEVQP